jgi:molybdate transport system substrate-binding protein
VIRRCTRLLTLTFALVASACGSDGSPAATPTSTSTTSPALSGPLTVFAAASLTEGFGDVKAANPAADITFNLAGSQALVTQLTQGASADVVATADEKSMQKLVDAGLVDTPETFATNALEIVVAPGNPKHVRTLADLARPDLLVVLEDPSVPAGSYSQEVLRRAGVTVRPRSLELDVKATLARVTSGEADAAIVYVTDVQAAGDKASGVTIPTADNIVARYPVARLKASRHRSAAAAFIADLRRGAGAKALRARGFLPAA